MKKILLLISLPLFFFLSVRAEEEDSIQKTCKEYREKVNNLIANVSKIKEQSLKNSFHQCWIIPTQDAIDDILTGGNMADYDLGFFVDNYILGDLIVNQRIDQKIQDYKKVYDQMTTLQKSCSINPYEPIISKKGDAWDYNPVALNFYFPQQKNIEQQYTITDLHNYLKNIVDYIKVSKTEEEIKFTDKLEKFFDDNNLWEYEPEELADIIIKDMLEFYQAKNTWSAYWSEYARARKECNINLAYAIHPNIVNEFALLIIEEAVHSLSIKKYDNIIEALQLISAQKGEHDTHKSAEKALSDIMQTYANKLVEKARGM